jgi:hypothetical protein
MHAKMRMRSSFGSLESLSAFSTLRTFAGWLLWSLSSRARFMMSW